MKSAKGNIKEVGLKQRTANSIKLHNAINNSNISQMENILKAGNVDIEFEDRQYIPTPDTTPLTKIVINCILNKISENDALKMLKILINYGADINKLTKGMTALTWAVDKKKPKMLLIDCLLKAGADVNLGAERQPFPLMTANQNEYVVEKLLAHGADMQKTWFHETLFDKQKYYVTNLLSPKSKAFACKKYSGIDDRKITYDFYMKADFVDSLFYRENKDAVQEKLKIAFLVDNYTDRFDFMIRHFKSLCAMKNSKMTKEQSTDFIKYLKQVINYDFLPKKLKVGLQDVLKDYQDITDNIEGFALWDALSIHAEENKSQQIKAPISFKQAQDILAEGSLADKEIFQSILGFCNLHTIYQGHSYLQDESSKDEIVMIMLIYTDFVYKVKEFYDKYKGVFYSEVLEQAIHDYQHMKP